MKKLNAILFLNFLFILILIILNTIFHPQIKFFSLHNLIILLVGSILTIILYYVFNKYFLSELKIESQKPAELKNRLLEYISEIEKINIDISTLETVYQSSIKIFESLIKDKETNAIIERHFRSIVDSEIKRAARYNLKFGLIILKIHRLSELKKLDINNILKNLNSISRTVLRVVDIIGRYENGLIYLLPQTDLKGTIRAAERILTEIKNSQIIPEELKFNLGVSCFPDSGKSYEALTKIAERNIFQAELLGGDKVIFGD